MTDTAQSLDVLQARLGQSAATCGPGTAGYEQAVNIWNAAITRQPSLVVRCAQDSDVVAALAFARANALEVSVRGGGHNYAGTALAEGGVMIDLTPMKVVTVDSETRRASCGGGTTWGELDAATQAHGLAVTGGFISRTGVAGLTLGGGIGWLVRPAGLSCDNLVGARVITVDGQVRHASDSEHRTCSGRSVVVAATLGWSPSSSSRCTRWARSRSSGCSCSIPTRVGSCSGSPATTSASCPTTAACSSPGSALRRRRSSRRSCTSRRCSGCWWSGLATRRATPS